MKVSDKPTEYVMVRANTNSEWDCCQFAIIHVSEEWREMQQERMDTIQSIGSLKYFGYDLQHVSFYDCSVDFYQQDEKGGSVDEILGDKRWAFVEMEGECQEEMEEIENEIGYYTIKMYGKGCFKYEAYGKYTDDEFWTDELPLNQLIDKLETKEEDK